ncbi:12240_t:CDS:2 [Funneliformis caledonium]|uniref:12240_t:CDS:1 n=1 Tax=Funneliformis caledonium TaxID=1117310 RepID=A0A9N9GQ76_9GLOM|nr:12240_t:CDS:2 [Funneliformis caledonium]
MITGSIDEETTYWDTPYEAGIEKENKTSASVVTPASQAKTDMYFDEEEEEMNETEEVSDPILKGPGVESVSWMVILDDVVERV